ncbi:hypothetical protein CTA1_11759 [Colletotrichum tanaceti]|uniref:Uncharacterized protein n=1 Tax=Colletotrichum tanaceti TaxID=1306861 RepID=A0A4U6XJJ0_9PEZI|nr:hypothetical protein CTA1_11759 [Colletotrichum tanaceti]
MPIQAGYILPPSTSGAPTGRSALCVKLENQVRELRPSSSASRPAADGCGDSRNRAKPSFRLRSLRIGRLVVKGLGLEFGSGPGAV